MVQVLRHTSLQQNNSVLIHRYQFYFNCYETKEQMMPQSRVARPLFSAVRYRLQYKRLWLRDTSDADRVEFRPNQLQGPNKFSPASRSKDALSSALQLNVMFSQVTVDAILILFKSVYLTRNVAGLSKMYGLS